jgi:hypothetical protein
MLESLKHVESLGQISLQDQKPLPSFLECEYDCNDYADGAWLLRTMNGESFLLIVEFRQTSQYPTESIHSLLKSTTSNSNFFQNVIARMCKSKLHGNDLSAAAAIAHGRYLYVVFQNDLDEDVKVDDNVLVLGKESISDFFIGLENAVRYLDVSKSTEMGHQR